MMIRHRGKEPTFDSSVFIAPTSSVVGDVKIGRNARIMYGAVLDSEGSTVKIGECTIICENAVLRATAEGDRAYPVVVEDHVFISPHATLLGCMVERCSYIATGATVLHGAVVHKGAAVAVGALVHARTLIPEGFFVPPNAIAIGDPVRLFSPNQREELIEAIKAVGFARIAFNAEGVWEERITRYRQATETRSKEFENHLNDAVL
jgi:carbonic anhydrase/acetyltransferase-like protein (isoleucine patch superfamily)